MLRSLLQFCFWLVLLMGCFCSPLMAQSPVQKGTQDYVSYWPGELPIVLSAPHGGTLRPAEIPDRPYGKLMRDTATEELSQEIRDALKQRLGKAPHLVVCHLARTKVDCNREIKEAAQGNPIAETAWREYHGYIDQAAASILKEYPAGLYLDIHGHSHPLPYVELGYLLGSNHLRLPAQRFNQPQVREQSSIRRLAQASSFTLDELVRGSVSLGAYLESCDIPTSPSPATVPGRGELYFSGGYSTKRHGSISGNGLDAIMIEVPRIHRENAQTRAKLAKAIAESVAQYLEKHGFTRGVASAPAP